MTAPPSLVQELLADQQSLTAVEQFSRAHNEQSLAHGSRYRNLIPLEAPRPGEQYAFEVDLDKCSGCKACVTACHSLNGLDDNETWREVGLLIEPPKRRRGTASPAKPQSSTLQHVTTACHHCVDPACLNGCPVLAYEKDSVTGIVKHLDDQCIGCQYCVLKCPYDVPKYNDRLGIVRKCDMCANRLAAGEAPACVQACPSEAIRITKAATETVTIQFRERQTSFLPGAPGGDYTLPTTRYVSAAPNSATPLVSADAATLRPQPTHWPLVLMLVLSQASVGVTGAAAYGASISLSGVALALGVASIGASVFHLGRPLGAWRFFLGLKRSWLSREILAFALYVPLLVLAAFWKAPFQPALSSVAAFMGLVGVFCSMMLYHDTRRALWNWRRSAGMFFGSTAMLGCLAFLALDPSRNEPLAALVIALVAKVLVEISVLRRVTDRDLTPLKKTALLITGPFQWLAFGRVMLMATALGGALFLNVGAISPAHAALAWLPFALAFAGEILERILFFRAVDAPKMPGGLPA